MNLKPKLPTSEITVLSPSEIQVAYDLKGYKILAYSKRLIIILQVVGALIGFFIGFEILLFLIFAAVVFGGMLMIIILIINYGKDNFLSYYRAILSSPKLRIKKMILRKKYLQVFDNKLRVTNVQTPINQHIDFKVNILENLVEVEYFDTIIPLYETASLPVLLDGIAAMHDFEFYDSTQLFDKTEVLTYKSKRVKDPNFPSLLIIQNRNRNLKIFDLLNQGNWLEFDFRAGEVYRSNVGISDTFQVLTTQLQKIEIFAFRGEYSNGNSNIQIKLTLGNGYKLEVFQTKDRKPDLELTTVRDAKKVYELLKSSDDLKHIEIELKEF